jgi:cytochrome P450
MTATLHMAYTIILRERTVVSLFILAASRGVKVGRTRVAQEVSVLLHYSGVNREPRQGRCDA